jgi:hypothetical protein
LSSLGSIPILRVEAGTMRRTMRGFVVALALCLTGCEAFVDAVLECLGSVPSCAPGHGRCDGSRLEVCREALCPSANYWEEREDCAATGRVCLEPSRDVAWCVDPSEAPTTVLAGAAPSRPDAR